MQYFCKRLKKLEITAPVGPIFSWGGYKQWNFKQADQLFFLLLLSE